MSGIASILTRQRHKLYTTAFFATRTGIGGVDDTTGWPEGWAIGDTDAGATEEGGTMTGWVVIGTVTLTGDGVSAVGTATGCFVLVVGGNTGRVEGGAVGVTTITG